MVLNPTQKAAAKRVSRAIRQAKNAANRPPPSAASDATSCPPSPIPTSTQQNLLDVFTRAFNNVLRPDGPDIEALLQELKAALFARDFATAFADARPDLLDAYAARWSPTRALAYTGVLAGIEEHFETIISSDENVQSLRVVSFGGCAAEVAALAGFLLYHNDEDTTTPLSASITLIDSAPWSEGVTRLHTELTTPPPLSKYASASAKASNAALISPSLLSSNFIKADALTLTRDQLTTHLSLNASPQQPLLVTLLFTLNELYTSGGIGKTTALLLNLSAILPVGSLLLVVDSPGSYSETTVGKESKRYPMHWLLDHCLLKKGAAAGDEGCHWDKIESDDSAWFRMEESLKYPIPLENMRYQMHLYRASKSQA